MTAILTMNRALSGTRERIDIETLIFWAYTKQKVGRTEWGGTMFPGGSQWDGIEKLESLGCFIDGGGGDPGCPDDALRISAAVQTMPDKHQRLMILQYASCGARPDWHADGVGRFEPERSANGRIKMLWDEHDNAAIATRVCFVGTSPDVVLRARLDYAAWWTGLSNLAVRLWGELARYEPTAPRAPRTPWKK